MLTPIYATTCKFSSLYHSRKTELVPSSINIVLRMIENYDLILYSLQYIDRVGSSQNQWVVQIHSLRQGIGVKLYLGSPIALIHKNECHPPINKAKTQRPDKKQKDFPSIKTLNKNKRKDRERHEAKAHHPLIIRAWPVRQLVVRYKNARRPPASR